MLVVCTGNICRSPMGAALLRHWLDLAGRHIEVGSAGVLPGARPASPMAVEVMREWGLDLTGHLSRQLTPSLVRNAEIIVCMERRHVRDVAVLEPTAWPRTFTLKELVRRTVSVPAREGGQALAAWAADLGLMRTTADMLGEEPADDVEDPIGTSVESYRRTAVELDELFGAVVAAAWP